MTRVGHALKALDGKLKELSPPVFVVVMTILSIVIVLLFLPVLYALEILAGPRGGPSFLDESLLFQFVTAVLLAPLLETLIFQAVPILILKKYTGFRPGTVVLVSSFWFAAAHSYSIAYVFYAFLIGLLLAYSYVIYVEKAVSAFWVVAAIHSLRNLFSFAMNNV
jgi:membrane protease YdiL (CAAX protease family)